MKFLGTSNTPEDIRSVPSVVALYGSSVTITNIAAALTEHSAPRTRVKVDLSKFMQARVTVGVNVVANAGAEVRIQYATDGDTQNTWAYLDGTDSPKVSIAALNGRVSPYVNLVAGARADVWIRVVTIGGDGAADPNVGTITLQVR